MFPTTLTEIIIWNNEKVNKTQFSVKRNTGVADPMIFLHPEFPVRKGSNEWLNSKCMF